MDTIKSCTYNYFLSKTYAKCFELVFPQKDSSLVGGKSRKNQISIQRLQKDLKNHFFSQSLKEKIKISSNSYEATYFLMFIDEINNFIINNFLF